MSYYTLTKLINSKNNYNKKDFYRNKLSALTCYNTTTIWNLSGILTGTFLTLISILLFRFNKSEIFGDFYGLLLITFINIKIFANNKPNILGIFSAFLGIGSFILYILLKGSLTSVMYLLYNLNKIYCISYVMVYLLISLFLA